MVLLDPEEGVRNQEIFHLRTPVVKHKRVPVRLHALARIGVFVEMRAVEESQSVSVVRKMGRNPIQDDADALLVQRVHQIHEIVRRAEPAGRSEIAYSLISPRSIER